MVTKKDNQIFIPDIMNRQDIISYFKDLIDIGPMLDIDWEKEMNRFKNKLIEIGWGRIQIDGLVQIACSQSIHLWKVPPPMRNRGNWRSWLDNRARSK